MTKREQFIYEQKRKSKGAAFALCLLLGGTGAHRFYAKNEMAWLMLVFWVMSIALVPFGIGFIMLGALGFWAVLDLFLIGGMIEAYNIKLMDSFGDD